MKIDVVLVLIMLVMVNMPMLSTKVMATNIDEATARQYGVYYLSTMTGKSAEQGQVSLAYKFMNEDLDIPAAYI